MERLTNGWIIHLRNLARQGGAAPASCPLCQAEIQLDIDSFRVHIRREHPTLCDDADIEEALKNVAVQSPQ